MWHFLPCAFLYFLLHQADPVLLWKTVCSNMKKKFRSFTCSPAILSHISVSSGSPESAWRCSPGVRLSWEAGAMGEGLWAVWALWLLFGGDKLTSGSQSRERAHLAVVMASGKKAVCPIHVSCAGLHRIAVFFGGIPSPELWSLQEQG